MQITKCVSFYPNLAIQNDLKPEHLGKSFNNRYNDIFQQRKSIPKSDPINYVFKIILNSSYGLSKEVNSYLYDPLFTFSITVNGQLLLLMLAEELYLNIPDVIFYQLNTDGITIGYDKDKYADKVKEILENFSKLTRLEVEEVFYKSMIIRDVNNYIGVYQKEGKEPKRKGIFEPMYGWENQRLVDYHKNPSFNVIPLALEEHFVHNRDYKEFIFNHTNFYDFCAATKKKSDFKLNYYIIRDKEPRIEEQQKVTRYFVSTTGGILMKDYDDGRQIAVESQVLVTPCNKLNSDLIDTYFKNIDYSYYIKATTDIIETIEVPKVQFKLAL